ncbi:MAG: hypothetical protein ABW215_10165 [Kibdelosporangium sp.]
MNTRDRTSENDSRHPDGGGTSSGDATDQCEEDARWTSSRW